MGPKSARDHGCARRDHEAALYIIVQFGLCIIFTKKMSQGFQQMQMIEEIDHNRDLFDILLDESSVSLVPSSNSSSEDFPSHHVCDHQIDGSKPIKKDAVPVKVKKVFCTCSKSGCQKKYCPCFREKETCGSECLCNGCQNKEFIPRSFKYIFGSVEQLTSPDISFSE